MDPDIRRIIAAVAMAAWGAEPVRIYAELWKKRSPSGGYIDSGSSEAKIAFAEMEIAAAHAAAWREWGGWNGAGKS